MYCLDIVRVVVPPGSTQSLGIPVVRNHVIVVSELLLADRAYPRLLNNVELRDDRYACSWCDHDGSRLLLVPYPKSPVPIRSLRYPQEAEIIGRVTGIAMLIAELQPGTSM